ncbi:putative LOC100903547 [Trichonephila clavipes]|uniref:Putative LOC100903547 n=1 Tax=Trichonephila clavipes TaxID=2585209 RepID=A0A8X6SBE4_TRICX|nr:putative LOC100903547 [Trichonephila clavipes]
MLVEAYGGNALSRAQCYMWFEKFQNGDFDVRNEELRRPSKTFEDAELRDQSIIYELLKPSETVNTDRYKQQLLNMNDAILEKREQYKKRQHKVIFLDDNAPSHRAK